MNTTRRTALTLFAASAVGLGTRGAGAGEATPLKLRLVGPTFAPYYYEDADGRLDGHLVRLFTRIAEHAGIPWTGTLAPAARMYRMLADGEADTSILVANQMLASGGVLQSAEPVSVMVLNAYRQEGLPAITDKEQLRGRSVAIMRGYSYGNLRAWLTDAANGVDVREINNEETIVRFLEARRAEIGLLYDVNYDIAVTKLGAHPKGLAVSNLARVPLYLHIHSRTVPNATAVLSRMVASYNALVASGALIGPDVKPETIDKPKATDADRPRSAIDPFGDLLA